MAGVDHQRQVDRVRCLDRGIAAAWDLARRAAGFERNTSCTGGRRQVTSRPSLTNAHAVRRRARARKDGNMDKDHDGDMDTGSAGIEQAVPWRVDRARRVSGLQVVSFKRTYVLPWTQFLYAEGAADEMRALFSLHDVVNGYGLDRLLADFAAQAVTELRQPTRAEKFQAFTPAGSGGGVGGHADRRRKRVGDHKPLRRPGGGLANKSLRPAAGERHQAAAQAAHRWGCGDRIGLVNTDVWYC
jgi:hypothetical protein